MACVLSEGNFFRRQQLQLQLQVDSAGKWQMGRLQVVAAVRKI